MTHETHMAEAGFPSFEEVFREVMCFEEPLVEARSDKGDPVESDAAENEAQAKRRTYAPYVWQRELAELVQDSGWPARVSVPTGLGKTSTILIAIYELARQMHFHEERTAPQRIFHVVDRRTIVDQTDAYVRKIAGAINSARVGSVLSPVKQALAMLLGPGQPDGAVIGVSSIHGRNRDDRAWMRATGCTIVTLTAQQFVSRLLMRGFGESRRVRPIAGALCAVDRLVLFDEPHLSAQSVSTILDAERLQNRAPASLGLPRSRTVLLGATVPEQLEDLVSDGEVFQFDFTAEGGSHPPALTAKRRAFLDWGKSADADIRGRLVKQARAAAERGSSRVVVFANTIAMAREVAAELMNDTGVKKTHRVRLVTSRFRPFERASLDLEEPGWITVSTQCLEVGVDVSFEALVTEACPWAVLVQRLGRLNRHGELDTASVATIVASWDEAADRPLVRSGTSAVYGERPVEACTRLLRRIEADHGIDVGLRGLLDIAAIVGDDRPAFEGEPVRLGTLHSGMLDLLAQTNPAPAADIPVSALIAGPDERRVAEVRVAWREDIDAILSVQSGGLGVVVQPESAEEVVVPRSALRSLLTRDPKASAYLSDVDIDASPVGDDGSFSSAAPPGMVVGEGTETHVLVWDETNENWRPLSRTAWRRELEDAGRVILHPRVGGYSHRFGWTGQADRDEQRLDISLDAALERLEQQLDEKESVRSTKPGGAGYEQERRILISSATLEAYLRNAPGEDEANRLASRRARTEYLGDLPGLVAQLADGRFSSDGDASAKELSAMADEIRKAITTFVARALDDSNNPPRLEADDRTVVLGSGYTVVTMRESVANRSAAHTGEQAQDALVHLDAHQRHVAAWSAADARAAGLPQLLLTEVETAALFHDEGKSWEPFQMMLRDRPLDPSDTSLAKSVGPRRRRASPWSSPGWRHEALSSLMKADDLSALATHLIAAHHGWGRPLFLPVAVNDAGGETAPGHDVREDAATEFAELNRRFGVWGLAYLESMLRLADWRASEQSELSAGFAPTDHDVDRTDSSAGESLVPIGVDAPSAPAEVLTHRLTGLGSHPMTSWYAVAGLLSAARMLGDPRPRVRWESLSAASDGAPAIPVLTTRHSLHELVRAVYTSAEWAQAETLAEGAGLARGGLSIKNQKLGPSGVLRRLLLDADGLGTEPSETRVPLLLALVGDLAPKAADRVVMPLMARANNSSYPAIAFDLVAQDAGLEARIDIAAQTLVSVNAGYDEAKCDGGMDRLSGADPAVNGLGDVDATLTRTALVPLVLFGLSRLGAGSAEDGFGVFRGARGRRHVCLPLPTRNTSLDELRALAALGDRANGNPWHLVGHEWVYSAHVESFGKSENVWIGRIERRRSTSRGRAIRDFD